VLAQGRPSSARQRISRSTSPGRPSLRLHQQLRHESHGTVLKAQTGDVVNRTFCDGRRRRDQANQHSAGWHDACRPSLGSLEGDDRSICDDPNATSASLWRSDPGLVRHGRPCRGATDATGDTRCGAPPPPTVSPAHDPQPVAVQAWGLNTAYGRVVVNNCIVTRAHHPVVLLTVIVLVAGSISAFLVNDTICLVMTPLVLDLETRSSAIRSPTFWPFPWPRISRARRRSPVTHRT
jgi:hypothetical protein